jgi:hypothetical protein
VRWPIKEDKMKKKPRRATVKLTRSVTEKAVVLLDKQGNIEEVEEVIEELDSWDEVLEDIYHVRSVHE